MERRDQSTFRTCSYAYTYHTNENEDFSGQVELNLLILLHFQRINPAE